MEGKELRNGYTTGSCAAAAAKAAAMELLTGNSPASVILTLPGGGKAEFHVQRVNVKAGAFQVSCYCVRKDSGDDPDVTDKILIYAACRAVSSSVMNELKAYGKGYFMEGEPSIYIDGGPGIGLATLEGLSCPVGHYAINPVPRSEIARAVREVSDEAGCRGDLLITIAVPEGVSKASGTFNPRLGIEGGISILGTSGIVRPMSEDAVLQTIRLELHMRRVSGDDGVILVPGNYGETFLKDRFGIPAGTAVQISNFVKDSVLMVCGEGFDKVLFAGHTGKLIKVAAGFPNTHSRYGDKRMETFVSLLEKVLDSACNDLSLRDDGSDVCLYTETGNKAGFLKKKDGSVSFEELRENIMKANTTDEALSILAMTYPACAESLTTALLDETAASAKLQMEEWSGGKLAAEVIVFSREGAMGMTAGARYHFSYE